MRMTRTLAALFALGILMAGCTQTELPQDPGIGGGDMRDQFSAAIVAGDEGKVSELLGTQPLLATAQHPTTGEWPIHLAAKKGNAAIVQLLLDAGADPTVRNDEGESAIDAARAGGAGDDVISLLQ